MHLLLSDVLWRRCCWAPAAPRCLSPACTLLTSKPAACHCCRQMMRKNIRTSPDHYTDPALHIMSIMSTKLQQTVHKLTQVTQSPRQKTLHSVQNFAKFCDQLSNSSPPNVPINTHTRLTALCPGLPRWTGTRKVKPIWILLKQETMSGSGISWAICKSAHRSRQIITPAPHHSVFYRPDALPAAQPTVSKH